MALRISIVAGIALQINEHFDKILLEWLDVSKEDIGAYAACYKIGCSWFCLGTAYFFFSHASNENAQQTYATITKYFVIFDHSFVFCYCFSRFIKTKPLPNPLLGCYKSGAFNYC
jgi:hypothetical protein